MRRHVLIGRFGIEDKVTVPVDSLETATEIEFVQAKRRFDHGIGDALDALEFLAIHPTEIGVDLMILAAHVHAADTRIARASESQDCWTREIRLVVPVSNVHIWKQTHNVLQSMLNFLTGDRWIIDFRARPRALETTVAPKPLIYKEPSFGGVSLFSGGLDSLIGAINSLQEGVDPLFVSHAGEGAVSIAQEDLFRILESKYPKRSFRRLRIWMRFPHGIVPDSNSEDSTRGRSFLFFASAALAASGFAAGCPIKVPENGMIALNVPLDPLRLSSLSTRTTHPFYIGLWNNLLAILGLRATLENPYWDQTKGEMVRGCQDQALLLQLVPVSLSCASPSKARWLGHPTEHCGYCLPCLIRRASLRTGLGKPDPTVYTVPDLTASPLKTSEAKGVQVRSFQLAIERLKMRPGLADLLIHKPGPLTGESDDRQARLGQVYLRGMMEVGDLLRDVKTEP
jgi:hypothetical protein